MQKAGHELNYQSTLKDLIHAIFFLNSDKDFFLTECLIYTLYFRLILKVFLNKTNRKQNVFLFHKLTGHFHAFFILLFDQSNDFHFSNEFHQNITVFHENRILSIIYWMYIKIAYLDWSLFFEELILNHEADDCMINWENKILDR